MADTETTFNTINDFIWTRKYQTTISAWETWKKEIMTLCDESKINLNAPLGQWTLDDNKYINPGNGSYPMISTHSIIENMEHGGNTHDLLTEPIGEFHSKQIQIQIINAPIAIKSS